MKPPITLSDAAVGVDDHANGQIALLIEHGGCTSRILFDPIGAKTLARKLIEAADEAGGVG